MCSFNGLLVKLLYREAIFLPSIEQECGKDLQDIVRQTRHSKSVQVLSFVFSLSIQIKFQRLTLAFKQNALQNCMPLVRIRTRH